MTDTSLPEELRRLGPRYDEAVLAATRSFYEPRVERAVVREIADLPYGPHERNTADLFLPVLGSASGVLVFVHGGGFVGGSKNEGAFYANVGRRFAQSGLAVLVPQYRLAPQYPWPCAALDLHLAIRWLDAHRHRWNIPATAPQVVFGHSAGATHVASVLFDRSIEALPRSLSAAMLLSGLYNPDAPLSAKARAYFGEDESLHMSRLPLAHVTDIGMPLWVGLAELDTANTAAQSYGLAQALCRQTQSGPTFSWLKGHNHVSTVFSIGTAHTTSTHAIRAFLEQVR